MKHLIVACAALLASVAPAFAGEALKAERIEAFIATLDETRALGEEFEASGKADALKIDNQPKAGAPFKPFSGAVAALKAQHPADHGRLEGVVKPHGFSAASWGETGDRVTLAYIAEKAEAENPGAMAQMAAMDPQMLQMVPPEMKAQMEAAMAMMETIRNAPAEDRAAIKPFIPALDAKFEAGSR